MAQVSDRTQEQALVDGLRRRDESAVAALLDCYWAPAYRVALGICADSATAEDVAHEGLVRALQGIESFRDDAPLRPWVLRIVANLARNERRASARRDERERAVARSERDRSQEPAAHAALREEASYVRGLLTQLPPQLRETLSLRYLDELSLNEVASALGCPAGTVSSRIRRGLARLREGLENAGSAVPKPVVGLGALGALTLLRGLVAPPAAHASEFLEAAASLPALPELLAAPEGPLAAGVGAALAGGAPPPPAPNEVLSAAREAAQGAVESAPQAAATLAPLAIVLVALALGGGAGGLLLSDPTPTPTRSASAASPRSSGLQPLVGAVPNSGLAKSFRGNLVAPTALRIDDRVTAVASLRWDSLLDLGYSGEDLSLSAELRGARGQALTLARGTLSQEAGVVRWPLELEAKAPGSALLAVSIRRGQEVVFAEEVAISVQGRQRKVRLVHNLTLSGPEGEATLTLDPRAAQLQEPRRLVLRVIPGLAAEATLSLRGLARQPTGCFEQTTAATYPSALVLALGTQNRASRETLEKARTYALKGSERLRRFQGPRGFSLHPGEPADPWLTAIGLRQLARLAGVVTVEDERLQDAAQALLAWQEPDGAFPIGAFVQKRAPKGRLAVSATACEALSLYLQVPSLEPAPEFKEALERGLDWLEGQASRAQTTVERAYLARALIAGGRSESAAKLLPSLLAQAEHPSAGQVTWRGEWSLTGGDKRAAQVETTALVVQVLSGLEERELVPPALAWLASQRRSRGFGGTQATIMALEAFLSGGSGQAKGRVTVSLGGDRLAPFEVKEKLEERALGEDPQTQAALFALALKRGVQLGFRGTGTLQIQVVAEGEVPWETPWGRDGQTRARGSEQLVYEVNRPLQGRVGTAQRWTLKVRNTGRAWSTSPMAQLTLPPGFRLETPKGREELDQQVEARRLRAWELLDGQRLVFYLPDLAPGQSAMVSTLLLPEVAGDFSGGSLEVYPYYDAGGVVASSLPQTQIAPALVIEARPPTLSRAPAPAAAAPAPLRTPSPTPSPSETPTLAAAPAQLTVAWDEGRLGKLDLTTLDGSAGDGPLEQLLARALCAYPGAGARYQETPGASAQVLLAAGEWTDGRPLTVDDYLGTLISVGKGLRRSKREQPLLAPISWTPFRGSPPRAGAGRALTWSHSRDLLPLLESAPFAARRPGKAPSHAGPYRPVWLEKGVLRLVPRVSGRAVDVIPVRRLRPEDAARFDLLWTQRARVADASVGRLGEDATEVLRPESARPFHLALAPSSDLPEHLRVEVQLDAKSLRIPEDLAGRPLQALEGSVTVVVPRSGSLRVWQRGLIPVAKRLRKALKKKGVNLDLVRGQAVSKSTLYLYATPGAGPPSATVLASYDSLLVPGRLDPGATLDHNGFMIWPPVVQEPDAEDRRRLPKLR